MQRARYGRQRDTCARARPCKRDMACSETRYMFWGSRHERARCVQRFRKMVVCLAGMGATPGATPQKEKVAVSAASPPSVDFSTEQVLACVQLVAQSVMFLFAHWRHAVVLLPLLSKGPERPRQRRPAGKEECRDCAAVPGRLTLFCAACSSLGSSWIRLKMAIPIRKLMPPWNYRCHTDTPPLIHFSILIPT